MQPTFKPNPAAIPAFRAAMEEYARLARRDTPDGLQKLMLQSGKRFVKNVANITPPAQGRADASAKKSGEAAILADLFKLASPVAGISRAQAREALTSAQDLLAAHARSRTGAQGRVNPRSRKEKLLVFHSDFFRVVKQLQSSVGWLAAGLNAAAKKLGFTLPAWISRHGSKFGSIVVEFSPRRLLIRVIQNVPFTDRVGGYARKWNAAFMHEVRTLQKMMGVLRDKAGIRARKRFRK